MADATDKSDKIIVAGVAIDGTKIRTVRETKKLTQLYVASVVGVTTDTISRWENNRYPSIKKENAQKLADALEVPLEEILREEGPDGSAPSESGPVSPSTPPSRHLVLLLVIGGALALLAAVYIFALRSSGPPVAVRWAPRFAAPGEVIPVQVKVTRDAAHAFGFILRERLPDGMRLLTSLPAGSTGDATRSRIKWLIPSGSAAVTISYSMQAPASQPFDRKAGIRGEIVLHGNGGSRTEAVGGSEEIKIGAFHWADSNGDGRIDDDEIMPAYYVCEEMKGFGLDWQTIEAIWSGKGYRWDAKNGYTVIK